MRVLHWLLLAAATYSLIVTVQRLDRRWFLRPEVRDRAWNHASWGAAVYWLNWASFLGWGWVTRWRWDPLLSRWFAKRPEGGVGAAHVVTRGVLGLVTGLVEFTITFAALLLVETALLALGLPPVEGK